MAMKKGDERGREIWRIIGRAKSMNIYSHSQGSRGGFFYNFAKARLSEAIFFWLRGLLMIAVAIVMFVMTSYTSLVLGILLFLVIGAIGLLFILAGVRVWRSAKGRK